MHGGPLLTSATAPKGNYSNCHHDGYCTTDVIRDYPGMYGPGASIDTNQEFHVRQDIHESDGSFTGYTTTLSQGDNSIILSSTTCGGYLNDMSNDMNQMVIAISNWGSDNMSWLDHDICSGSCSTTNTWSSLKNLQFNSSSNPAPSPTPTPTPQPDPEDSIVY